MSPPIKSCTQIRDSGWWQEPFVRDAGYQSIDTTHGFNLIKRSQLTMIKSRIRVAYTHCCSCNRVYFDSVKIPML